MAVSGQFLYFTAGDKEVRTWMLHIGGTALEAADNIHTDLARGFIRAEVMRARRPDPAGQRARDQGAQPPPPGAEGLRRPRRRHPAHQVQRLTCCDVERK